MEQYTTIEGEACAEIVEKKSRFIAQLSPVATEEEALAFLEGVRGAHRMARHHVFAYILREGARVRYSDGGEPPKTAGLPTLEALRHAGLTDVAAVVTRYFGGTLLGTGGLVRAYTLATQAAIEKATLVTMSLCVDIEARIPYSEYDQAMHVAGRAGAKVADTDFSDTVYLRLRVPAAEGQDLITQLAEVMRGSKGITMSVPYWTAF